MCLNLGQIILHNTLSKSQFKVPGPMIFAFLALSSTNIATEKPKKEKVNRKGSYLTGFKDPKQRVQEGWHQCCSSQWNSFRYPVYRGNNQDVSTRGFLQGGRTEIEVRQTDRLNQMTSFI